MVRQPKNHISELQFEKFLTLSTVQCWKTSSKTEVCSVSDHPSESMLWIKDVEMVESVDDDL